MKSAPSPIKIIASFLSAVLLTEAVFAHTPEVNFWKERQQAVIPAQAGIQAPRLGGGSNLSQFGSIRKKSNAQFSDRQTSQTIIHIQDIHLNDEAQKNIGAAVQNLVENNQVDLIALEGAFGPIDLTYFQEFPRRDAMQHVADYLLRDHKISGPIYALLTNPSPYPLPERERVG